MVASPTQQRDVGVSPTTMSASRETIASHPRHTGQVKPPKMSSYGSSFSTLAPSNMSSSRLPTDDSNTLLTSRGSRRSFLRNTAVTALAGGVLAACKRASDDLKSEGLSQKPPVAKVGPDSDHSGGTMAAHPAAVPQQSDADKMDAMLEAGIKAFPAKTAG